MKAVPIGIAEKNFIWEYRNELTPAEIASKVSTIFGTKRHEKTIYNHIKRRRYREKSARSKYVDVSCLLGIRNFKPEITNWRLVWVMTKTNTTLFDIAAAAGIDIDHVRGLVSMGGIPKLYAKPVKDFYKDMGIVV